MEKTTACVPPFNSIADGVLPTYLPSRVISAPEGVEVKLHLTFAEEIFCGWGGAEADGATGAAEGEIATGAGGCGAGACGDATAGVGEAARASEATRVYNCFRSLPLSST